MQLTSNQLARPMRDPARESERRRPEPAIVIAVALAEHAGAFGIFVRR